MPSPYTITEDEIEEQSIANHVGHFLLTNLTMPKLLVASQNVGMLNVSSFGKLLPDVLTDSNLGGDGKEYNPFMA